LQTLKPKAHENTFILISKSKAFHEVFSSFVQWNGWFSFMYGFTSK
jgi:hypothetical protein